MSWISSASNPSEKQKILTLKFSRWLNKSVVKICCCCFTSFRTSSSSDSPLSSLVDSHNLSFTDPCMFERSDRPVWHDLNHRYKISCLFYINYLFTWSSNLAELFPNPYLLIWSTSLRQKKESDGQGLLHYQGSHPKRTILSTFIVLFFYELVGKIKPYTGICCYVPVHQSVHFGPLLWNIDIVLSSLLPH